MLIALTHQSYALPTEECVCAHCVSASCKNMCSLSVCVFLSITQAFIDAIWYPLRDARPFIREAGMQALKVCVVLLYRVLLFIFDFVRTCACVSCTNLGRLVEARLPFIEHFDKPAFVTAQALYGTVCVVCPVLFFR